MFVCVCVSVTVWHNSRVGVNLRWVGRNWIRYLLFRAWKLIKKKGFCVNSSSESTGIKLTPALNEYLLYTQVLPWQLIWLVVLFMAEYMPSCATLRTYSCQLWYEIVFERTYFRKQVLLGCNLDLQKKNVEHLKPAWIIRIMPQSVCSQVQRILQTWGQNWVLKRSERKVIRNIQRQMVMFVSYLLRVLYDELTSNCGPVEKLYCTISIQLHSDHPSLKKTTTKKQSRAGKSHHW